MQWLWALLALVTGVAAHPAPRPVPVPIGVGPQFRLPPGPPVAGGAPIGGLACTATPAAAGRSAHLELFANGRVVPIPAAIGVAPPRTVVDGVVTTGRCRYPLSTDDPTGVVRVTGERPLTVGALFRIWGQPLGAHRLCGFRSAAPVRAWVDGRRWRGRLSAIPLRPHAEIVLELGAHVPPHVSYLFPEGT